MSKQHDIKSEKDARTQRGDVAPVIVQFKLSDKEKAHAADTKDDCDQIAPMELFADDEGRKYQDINWSGVLQKYGVCRRRVLCRPDKQKKKRRVDNRRDRAKQIYSETALSS